MEHNPDNLFADEDHELESIPYERFVEAHIAEYIQCTICLGVPMHPTITQCGHFHCKGCITKWLETSESCTKCRGFLTLADVAEIKGFYENVHQVLHVNCRNKEYGCVENFLLKDLSEHENQCQFTSEVIREPVIEPENVAAPLAAIIRKKTRGPGVKKIPLSKIKDKADCRKHRLKPFYNSLESLCDEHFENKKDVLFFMLRSELHKSGDTKKVKALENLWVDQNDKVSYLSEEQSLAIRVDTLLTKGQYKKVYAMFDEKLETNVLQPPSRLDNKEKEFLPGSTEFQILDQQGNLLVDHKEIQDPKPIDIRSEFSDLSFESPVPNIKGVRWNYAQAIAQTLKEIDPVIDLNLKTKKVKQSKTHLNLKTIIKDGGDGLGDVSVYKEKNDRLLPDKAFRFSFAVVSCKCQTDQSEKHSIYETKNPNSVRTNRPLLEAIADENDKDALIACIRPIEMEREYLKDKIIKVKVGENNWRCHTIKFYNSMVDEKHDRVISGLQGSGSGHICNLCHATNKTCKELLGHFNIDRSLSETKKLAKYLQVNPDNLGDKALASIAKGVKNLPVSTCSPSEKLIDATHADINIGRFFQKLIIREIAGTEEWEAKKEHMTVLKNAEHRFDMHLKQFIGINPQLMMPGNYARELFDEKNKDIILQIIPDSDVQRNLEKILNKFRFLRAVYRATSPSSSDIVLYKKTATEMGKMLIEHFDYAPWPNYLHKVIEHVQEILADPEGPGSIGAFSGEGNEAGNKLFRLFRKNYSTRGDSFKALEDVIKLHWFYSSCNLQKLSEVTPEVHKCTICKQQGHNKKTCRAAR